MFARIALGLAILVGCVETPVFAAECSEFFRPTFVRKDGRVYYVNRPGSRDPFIYARSPDHAQELCLDRGVVATITGQGCTQRNWGDFTCGCDSEGMRNEACGRLTAYLQSVPPATTAAPGGPVVLGSISARIVAPGNNRHRYHLTAIDTRRFANGGELIVEILVGTGIEHVSFDLFPEGAVIPQEGFPQTSVAQLYNVQAGSTVTLRHVFASGQIFRLGAEGSWYDEPGRSGSYTATIRVIPK